MLNNLLQHLYKQALRISTYVIFGVIATKMHEVSRGAGVTLLMVLLFAHV